MSRCTAPVRGHSSSAAVVACPVCRYRSRGYGGYGEYNRYGLNSYSSYSTSPSRSSSGSVRSSKPRWSKSGSPVLYTSEEIRTLTPIREKIEKQVAPDLRDVFLCHAWDDRQGVAKELHDLLVSAGVKVWFSEKDLELGVPMMRAIDKGLANSRIGLVLVTPALLRRLPQEGIADKELSALLARDQLIPIVHNTTFENLREVSPLLGSRSGLNTSEEAMKDIAAKIAELVFL